MGVKNPQSEFDDNIADHVTQIRELESAILAEHQQCRRCRLVYTNLDHDTYSPHPTYVQQLYRRVWTLLQEYMQNNLLLRDKMRKVAGEIAQLTATNECFAEHRYH